MGGCCTRTHGPAPEDPPPGDKVDRQLEHLYKTDDIYDDAFSDETQISEPGDCRRRCCYRGILGWSVAHKLKLIICCVQWDAKAAADPDNYKMGTRKSAWIRRWAEELPPKPDPGPPKADAEPARPSVVGQDDVGIDGLGGSGRDITHVLLANLQAELRTRQLGGPNKGSVRAKAKWFEVLAEVYSQKGSQRGSESFSGNSHGLGSFKDRKPRKKGKKGTEQAKPAAAEAELGPGHLHNHGMEDDHRHPAERPGQASEGGRPGALPT